MNLRAVALCAWVASLTHLLLLFNRLDVVSPGAAALVATGLLSSIPLLWVASAVLLAPGDLNAVLSLLTGRADALPMAVPATPESVSKRFSRRHADDTSGESSGADEKASSAFARRGDGRDDADARAKNAARRSSPSPSSRSPGIRGREKNAANNGENDSKLCASASDVDERHERHERLERLDVERRGDRPVSLSLSKTPLHEELDPRDAFSDDRASDFDSDSDSDSDLDSDAASWRDAVVGIKGMAHALRAANNHVSAVALNADLTVSLSTMLLNAVRVFEDADGASARGTEGGARGTVSQLVDVHELIAETCALAEPLFDEETPLVVFNRVPSRVSCFLPRDAFACCLFALVYSASARTVRGACRLTAENSPAEGAGARGAAAFPHPETGVRVSLEYATSRVGGGDRRAESRASGSVKSGGSDASAARGSVTDERGRLGSAEMQFWRRRLRRLGGSLSVRRGRGESGVGTETEIVAMWVPTRGSETFAEDDVARPDPITNPEPAEREAKAENESVVAHRDLLANAKKKAFKGYDGTDGTDAEATSPVVLPLEGSRRTQRASARFPDASPGDPRRASIGSSYHDSLYDSYVSTISSDFSILYIEDERVQAYFFINKCKRVFGDRCRVAHETDGVAALERLDKGEQFAVVVSDIFMAGMDGVSFFHALFDSGLNTGNANANANANARWGGVPGAGSPPPRLNIILTGADVDPSRGALDAELSLDLNDLQEKYGVLCYNKTSAVDVVSDVIKPHVAFVERALTSRFGFAERSRSRYREEFRDDGFAMDEGREDWIAPPTRVLKVENHLRGSSSADAEDQIEMVAVASRDENVPAESARSEASSGAVKRAVPEVSSGARAAEDAAESDASGTRQERS